MISVVIVTYWRNPMLLKHLVEVWLKLGCEVVLVSHTERIKSLNGLKFIQHDVSPTEYGNAIQSGLDACSHEYAYLSADDILPVDGWKRVPLNPNSITAINLLNVNGKRYYDWAYVEGDVRAKQCKIHVQYPEERHAQTYITGGAQLIHLPSVQGKISYRGGIFRESEDVIYCFDAEARGIQLLPPKPEYPTCIHLNEKES